VTGEPSYGGTSPQVIPRPPISAISSVRLIQSSSFPVKLSTMLSDRLLELGGFAHLQRIASGKSPWAVLATIILIASVGVIVDYACMLWLRPKMVSSSRDTHQTRY
jgi:hypothetical protein